VLFESALRTGGNKTLLGVLTTQFVTEENMSYAKESLSLDVLSALLFVLSDDWPDISTVKNMSNKCGIYELILSAFRSFVGGHDI